VGEPSQLTPSARSLCIVPESQLLGQAWPGLDPCSAKSLDDAEHGRSLRRLDVDLLADKMQDKGTSRAFTTRRSEIAPPPPTS
jgi:hypothetical protein